MPEIPSRVPALRWSACNASPVASDGDYVLYWMIAQRRTVSSFSLERAIDWAAALAKPLLIFEALRCGYPWASDRLHRFILQGMAVNGERLAATDIGYFPYVERQPGDGRGLLAALAERAAVVVTDDFPCFFLPRMVAAAASRLPVRLEKVDTNGLLPMRAAGQRIYARAVDFRRYLQKTLPQHLADQPDPEPLKDADLPPFGALPASLLQRWPRADVASLVKDPGALADFAIDHSVAPVAYRGGSEAAEEALEQFVTSRLERYGEGRKDVEDRATSELSPYLHFGHISPHQVFAAVVAREAWDPGCLAPRATASRSGWWGMSGEAESFLDELLTWRELGYNMCSLREDYDTYESLPEWARRTLAEHTDDARPYIYSLEQFESAATHDELWNAAQRELVRDGRIHNYLRMLWGKKILEWTATPREALAVMIELNNKYAVDGRNPNSYSGIFWCLGRYDRAWGPERPIFGKVRYMSSDSTRRKLAAAAYIARYSEQPAQLRLI